jgi:hypothetical protein
LRPAEFCIGQLIAFTACAPNAEEDDLFVLRGFRRTESVGSLVPEVESKNAPANGETISRNNQSHHACGLEPAIAVLEEYLL